MTSWVLSCLIFWCPLHAKACLPVPSMGPALVTRTAPDHWEVKPKSHDESHVLISKGSLVIGRVRGEKSGASLRSQVRQESSFNRVQTGKHSQVILSIPFLGEFFLELGDRALNSGRHIQGTLRKLGQGGLGRQLGRRRGAQGGSQDREVSVTHLTLDGP